MFADPQFWVAVSFLLFIVAIFNPARKILKLSLDTKIDEIKNQIKEAENIKSDAQKTLSELKSRELEMQKQGTLLGMSQAETAAYHQQRMDAEQTAQTAAQSGFAGVLDSITTGLATAGQFMGG